MSRTKKILLLGAGRSAFSLIEYLSNKSAELNIELIVIDRAANETIKKHKGFVGKVIDGDLSDRDFRQEVVRNADVVVSMLPVNYHLLVAEDCIEFSKHMVTASYVTSEMEALHDRAKKADVLLLNEIGLDPGIDHMSAMKIIQEIKDKGGRIMAFESFTGGLLAPESEEGNPWKYKFTWNPRNVVIAGSGGAVKFLDHGAYKYIPYHRVFRRTELIDLRNYGKFEGYANRDSLKYQKLYGLEDVKTMYRGTLRKIGFCKAWDMFVQLGVTADDYVIENSDSMTFRSFINSFLKFHPTDSVELKLMQYLKLDQDDIELMEKLEWLDLFKEIKIPLSKATPAQILQYILERKWSLEKDDKDMIVMWHKFIYELDKVEKELHSFMVVKGFDQHKTAMSITVGLPVAMAVEGIVKGEFKIRGVARPLDREIYIPILSQLKHYGIDFEERVIR